MSGYLLFENPNLTVQDICQIVLLFRIDPDILCIYMMSSLKKYYQLRKYFNLELYIHFMNISDIITYGTPSLLYYIIINKLGGKIYYESDIITNYVKICSMMTVIRDIKRSSIENRANFVRRQRIRCLRRRLLDIIV